MERRKLFPVLPLILLFAILFSGCGRNDGTADSAGEETVYPVRGVVQKRMDDPSMILIDHEEIPGFMPRMVMPFRVLDPSLFEGLEPGMEVTLDFHVTEMDSWATNVVVTGKSGPITLDERADSSKLLGVGDELPDYEFVDETGETVRLSDFRGMPVAVTFVFSRCPVPEYCPRMMNHFATVREKLDADPEAPKSYRLLTISFDSQHDSSEIMKAWGAGYGHKAGQSWSLLSTPESEVIDSIASRVGLRFGESNGTLQHNLRTLVLDGNGVIRALYTDESWSVDELITEIKKSDL
ncbi:SCO family protein [Verrucomicrobiales bacterium BCK34]|nr:SCO family protein [Verrucomicrobiales bacterium BCK34]